MPDNFLALIDQRKPDIEKMLAEWITPERFFAMAMQIKRNPELAECTDDSLVDCVVQAAQLGLEIGGTRGHFYVIKYGKAAQGQPGWRGLAFLRLKAGSVMSIDTDVVFKEDRFEISRSSDGDKFTHVLNVMGCERTEANAMGAYAKVVLPTGEIQFEWTSRDRIQRHRNHSKQPNGMLWDPKKFWEEGWRKTPYRILDKRLPEGSNEEAMQRYERAVQLENSNYRSRDTELNIGPEPDDSPTARQPKGGVELVVDGASVGKKKTADTPSAATTSSTTDGPISQEESDELVDTGTSVIGLKASAIMKLAREQFKVADLTELKKSQVQPFIKAMEQAAA